MKNYLVKLLLITCALLPNSIFAQFANIALPPSEIVLPPRYTIRVPAFNEPSNRFAYIQEISNVQHLRLARLNSDGLMIEARDIATLESFDLATTTILYEEIKDLSADPQNRWLASYSLQEYFGFNDAFTDHNLKLYSMADGASIGLVNEHALAGLNNSLATSQRLEEFKQLERDLGVPDYVVDTYDYEVITEGVTPAAPSYQWNTDGTLTYSIELDVMYSDNGYVQFIGSEVFSITFALTPTSLTRLGFNLNKTAATVPACFALSPAASSSGQTVAVDGWTVQFVYYEFYWNNHHYIGRQTRQSTMVEGNIPRAYSYIYF